MLPTHCGQETDLGKICIPFSSTSVERYFLIQVLRYSQFQSLQATLRGRKGLYCQCHAQVDLKLGEVRAQGGCQVPSRAPCNPGASTEEHKCLGPNLWVSVQNPLWLQKKVILQGLRQGQLGHEEKALSAKQLPNGTAAEMLQTARAVGQGKEGLVERLVHLKGRRGDVSLGTRNRHTSLSQTEEPWRHRWSFPGYWCGTTLPERVRILFSSAAPAQSDGSLLWVISDTMGRTS